MVLSDVKCDRKLHPLDTAPCVSVPVKAHLSQRSDCSRSLAHLSCSRVFFDFSVERCRLSVATWHEQNITVGSIADESLRSSSPRSEFSALHSCCPPSSRHGDELRSRCPQRLPIWKGPIWHSWSVCSSNKSEAAIRSPKKGDSLNPALQTH